MFSDIVDWFTSLFDNDGNDEVMAEETSEVEHDGSFVAHEIVDNADAVDVEPGSVDDMLNNGITTTSVSDKEISEMKGNLGQTEFTGHTSCECNLCGCTTFVPNPNNSRLCKCGHDDYQHRWRS